MSKIHIFDGNHHGSLLVKDGELFFNNGLEESAHEGQDGKGYRQLVDDCTAELARLAERNEELKAEKEKYYSYGEALDKRVAELEDEKVKLQKAVSQLVLRIREIAENKSMKLDEAVKRVAGYLK